ncbi:MAG: CPBP family intramembrane glutamic endopeptidase [Candidatus Hodarchaeales archaeon]|jgi:membrane protease YdiL (CAAX protease family)
MTSVIPEGLEKKITWGKNALLMRIVVFYITIVVLLFALQVLIGQLIISSLGRELTSADLTLLNNLLRGLTGVVGMITCFLFLKYDNLQLKIIGLKNFRNSYFLFMIAGIITAVALVPTVLVELLLNIIPVDIVASLTGIEIIDKTISFVFNILPGLELIILTILFSFVGIGLGEEIIFRGYIQNVMESGYSFIQSTIVSAFLFGLLHFIIGVFSGNLIYMITWGIAGLIFGIGMSYVYKITDSNLIIPIAIHGFWDAYLFLFQAEFVYTDWFMAVGEIVAQIIGVVVFSLLTLVVLKRFWPEIVPSSFNNMDR